MQTKEKLSVRVHVVDSGTDVDFVCNEMSEWERRSVIVKGVEEHSKNTRKSTRKKNDLDSAVCILSSLNPEIDHKSISDTKRLGHFHPPRPMLVKLRKEEDVATVLHRRGPSSHIDPYKNKDELEKDVILRENKRSLVDSGMDPRSIKLSPPFLMVNNELHGYVDSDNIYQKLPPPSV